MRVLTLVVGILLMFFCVVTPAQAANPDQVSQLITRRACVNCDLRGADLRGLNLTKVNLKGADLREANLMATTFKDADLRGADLSDADMLGTNFIGANLKQAKVNPRQMKGVTLCKTIQPNGKQLNRDCEH